MDENKQQQTEKVKTTDIQNNLTQSRPLLPSDEPASGPAVQAKDSLLNSSIPPSGLNGHRVGKNGVRDRSGKRSKVKKIVLSVIGVLVVGGLAAVGWDGWQLYHKLNHLNVGNLTASVNGQQNILVAGSTNRCNLKVQNAQWGFCSQGVTGVNSDVIFIIHMDPKTGKVSLLSIPRDTFVPDARSGNEAFKIDAALYQGPSQLVKAVEEDFGIPIQHYVEVGFDGFVNIVNAVGGVKMYFPMAVYDSDSHLKITTPGCKSLNGVEALQVVRARHLQYKAPGITTNDVAYWPQEAESDIARITRSHEFLKVLASTVEAKGLSNPITDQKLIDAIAPQVQVDSGFSVSSMLQLVEAFHSVGVNNVPQTTLPISLTKFGSYYYEGSNFGDVVFPAQPQDLTTIDQFLGVNGSTDPWNGKPLPKPSSVAVNVINGSGVLDQATTISSGLSSLGFNLVGQPGSVAPSSRQANETVVYYASASTEPDAISVLSKLSGPVILSRNASMVSSGSKVTVVSGTDAAVIQPGQSSSSSSTSSSVAGSDSLATPTNASQNLAPWDPRQCPKS